MKARWQEELEAQSFWSIQERRVTAAMDNYLERSDERKAEVEALELLMGPEESEVCLRYVLAHAGGRKRQQDLRDFQHKRGN